MRAIYEGKGQNSTVWLRSTDHYVSVLLLGRVNASRLSPIWSTKFFFAWTEEGRRYTSEQMDWMGTRIRLSLPRRVAR